jgi:type VI secretion system protein ImpM
VSVLAVSEIVEVGLYGKLPSHGDFLQRRVPPEFLTSWDGWLQSGIAASRTALAHQWEQTYLTSPVWRFALSASACGRAAVAGLMAPSVDRVGRFFPLTLMWRLPAHVSPIVYAAVAGPWLAPAEQLLVESLTSEEVDFERFDEQVSLLGPSLGTLLQADIQPLEAEDLERVIRGDNAAWHVPTGAFGSVPAALGAMVTRTLETAYEPLTVWWTDGSAVMEPCCLVVRGMPGAEAFVSLLDGSWDGGLWRSVRASTSATAPRPITAPVLRGVEVIAVQQSGVRSAGGSDSGMRPSNQDAWLERPEIGLWAVADGLGGLSAGEVASRMVCDVLASLAPSGSLDSMIEDIRRGLDEVNATLHRASRRPLDPVASGSTVVAMTIREGRTAILWAGDSRAYRLRGDRLERLTADHSEEESEEVDSPSDASRQTGGEDAVVASVAAPLGRARINTAVTRAVGGAEVLELDLRVEAVQPGDRFLLCSDGLTRALDDQTLSQLLAAEMDLTRCAGGLLAAANQAHADDNVTVVVVDVCVA